LQVTSPGVIDLWEALVTLLMFPLLVGVAYLADRNMLCGQTRTDNDDGMFSLKNNDFQQSKIVSFIN